MRYRLFTLAGAVLLVVTTQNAVYAQVRPNWQSRLDLTDEQKAQIEELTEQHGTAAAEASAEIIKARAEVQSLRIQPDPDLNALLRAMNRLSELENTHQIEAMKHRKALENVLTEEQREKLRLVGRAAGTSFPRFRAGLGRAFGSRARSFTRGLRGFERGIQLGRGRGIPPQADARFDRIGRGMRMRAIRPQAGGAAPPPPPVS